MERSRETKMERTVHGNISHSRSDDLFNFNTSSPLKFPPTPYLWLTNIGCRTRNLKDETMVDSQCLLMLVLEGIMNAST